MNDQKCENCFHCETNIKPFVTAYMMQEIHKANKPIPQSWFKDTQKEVKPEVKCTPESRCETCEKCFEVQEDNCDKCFTCEKCYEGQEESGCDKCFTCEKCYEGQEQDGCENCFSCEKCYTAQGEFPKGGERFGVTYFFFLTNNCNLRCTYCYAHKTPPTMTRETLDQAIKFIIEDEEKRIPNRDISIQFFGGEPTVRWDDLVYTVETMNKLAMDKLKRNIKWGMTTNGTLLTEERLAWLKSVNLSILLSLDGRQETHDKHRVYPDGRGSWEDIPFDMILKYYGTGMEIRPTILPDTVEDWYKDLMWFHSKGCYTVATEVAYEADWNDEAMAKASKMYNQLADKYIQMKKEGKKFWMKFVDDGRSFLGSKKQTGTVCGIGRNSIAIDANGFLYACQRYASFSEQSLNLGNIWTGFEENKLTECNALRREDMDADPKSEFKCETCPALWRCRGGCNAMNYQCNGDRKVILENSCKFQRLWAEISLRALSATGELHDLISRNK